MITWKKSCRADSWIKRFLKFIAVLGFNDPAASIPGLARLMAVAGVKATVCGQLNPRYQQMPSGCTTGKWQLALIPSILGHLRSVWDKPPTAKMLGIIQASLPPAGVIICWSGEWGCSFPIECPRYENQHGGECFRHTLVVKIRSLFKVA